MVHPNPLTKSQWNPRQSLCDPVRTQNQHFYFVFVLIENHILIIMELGCDFTTSLVVFFLNISNLVLHEPFHFHFAVLCASQAVWSLQLSCQIVLPVIVFCRHTVGDSTVPFCLQSCVKPLKYAVAVHDHGSEYVHQFIGKEPSGLRFNKLSLNEEGEPVLSAPLCLWTIFLSLLLWLWIVAAWQTCKIWYESCLQAVCTNVWRQPYQPWVQCCFMSHTMEHLANR